MLRLRRPRPRVSAAAPFASSAEAQRKRLHSVWFNPGSRKFIVVDGHGGLDHNVQGNDVCQIDEELQPHQKYRIRIEMRQKFVEVWMALCTGSSCAAEELRCTEPREDRIAFPHAQVFASDTFYEPADAEIDNFFMTTLEPVAGCTDFSACNHNPRASEDDGSCRRPVNMVCSQQHRVTTKMCQQAAPPPPPSQVYRPSSGQQYRPPPPPAIGGVGSSVGAGWGLQS